MEEYEIVVLYLSGDGDKITAKINKDNRYVDVDFDNDNVHTLTKDAVMCNGHAEVLNFLSKLGELDEYYKYFQLYHNNTTKKEGHTSKKGLSHPESLESMIDYVRSQQEALKGNCIIC